MGTNDTTIFVSLVCVFIALGVIIPVVTSGSSYNVESVQNNVTIVAHQESNPSIFDVVFGPILTPLKIIASVIVMFFWSFQLPLWVDLLMLEPLRIAAYFVLFRLIRGSGG